MGIAIGTHVKVKSSWLALLLTTSLLNPPKRGPKEGVVLFSEIGEKSGALLYTLQLNDGSFAHHFGNELRVLKTANGATVH
jgi:hypothetical protein